ncbi:MAG: T9SS type A sorting domain-containing protein, partial [Bacteroidales bacterium]|nr:T9SS type A sorting domain-containing protein [Bacteroidales bacterium]
TLLVASTGIQAQFQKSYGTYSSDEAHSVVLSKYKPGYVIAASSNAVPYGGGDGVLQKTDVNGNLLWTKIYGTDKTDVFKSVREVAARGNLPAGYIVTGYTNSVGYGQTDMLLMRTDLSGNPIFYKVYGNQSYDWGNCINYFRNDQEDGYIMVGSSYSYQHILPSENVMVVKTDIFGNLKRSVIIGHEGYQRGHWIQPTRDYGYIIAGYSYAPNNCSGGKDPDILVIKLDRDLNLMWSRVFADTVSKYQQDMAWCVKENRWGQYIVSGYTQGLGIGDYDAFLLALSPSGSLLWMNTYGYPRARTMGSCVNIKYNKFGTPEYAISGTNMYHGKYIDAMILKTNSSGNLMWAMEYGLDGAEKGREIITSDRGGYAFVGALTSFGAGSWDNYLVETDANGSSKTICDERIKLATRKTYPCITKDMKIAKIETGRPVKLPMKKVEYKKDFCTPIFIVPNLKESEIAKKQESIKVSQINHQVHIEHGEQFLNGSFSVFNTMGQEVISGSIQSSNLTYIETSDLPMGVYLIRIVDNTKTHSATERILLNK